MNQFASLLKSIPILCALLVSGCGGYSVHSSDLAQQCFDDSGNQYRDVLTCYRNAGIAHPVEYSPAEITEMPGVQKRHIVMTSQNWAPSGLVQPTSWTHDVDIYIPVDALSGRALLIANNGINIATANDAVKPVSDFTEATAISIAQQTKTIVVSVSNIPNQYLTYLDDGIARREDSSVAHSWKLFLQSPEERPFMSLHVPMMESLVKGMDVAVQELQPWKIKTFIATGASKRAWAAWLAAISDSRIDAVVPFVIDILGMDKVIDHTYQVYGGNWPLAFGDYFSEGITSQRHTENFGALLQIEDPLRYLHSAHANRLTIPKYIVNASGDDFFVPDNTQFYFDQLPGAKTLRVAPNSDHYGIRNFVETSLVALVNRIQRSAALPTARLEWTNAARSGESIGKVLTIAFSEMPVKVLQWRAVNPVARDFRYACGIRYLATPIDAAQHVTVSLAPPGQGWQATFVEAKFADGFVTTTPVTVLPDIYLTSAPPESGAACKTIPDQ
jgi:PhoPQ-activated pathogenicity-related protein